MHCTVPCTAKFGDNVASIHFNFFNNWLKVLESKTKSKPTKSFKVHESSLHKKITQICFSARATAMGQRLTRKGSWVQIQVGFGLFF